MNYRTKQLGATFAIPVLMLAGIVHAQSIKEGITYLNNDQFNKSKEVFEGLVTKTPTADNYFYLGYYYLKLKNPNIEMATQNFNKGLAVDPKSNLNKIGLAAIKLYQNNKSGADADFSSIAQNTKYKNADVLYQIANAYIMFPDKKETKNGAKSVEYSQRLLELVKNKDKAEYYLVLGNAYEEVIEPGKAIQSYDKAIEIGAEEDKARAYSFIAGIRSRTINEKSYKMAEDNFKEAIKASPNSAFVYKQMSDFYSLYSDYANTAIALQKYVDLTGNNDADTQFNLSRLAYFTKDYDKANDILTKNWEVISDPLKYKLKALILMEKSDFKGAYTNMQQYMQNVEEDKKVGFDYGMLGKIQSSLATTETEEEKEKLTKEAIANMTLADSKGDKAYDYQSLIAAMGPVVGNTVAGATNAKIEALKKSLSANDRDTKSWYDLAMEQYEVKDYLGSVNSWNKLIELIPSWEVPYAGKAMSLRANDPADTNGLAAQSFQKYIDMVAPKSEYSENENFYLSMAYMFFGYKYLNEENKEKTQEYVDKMLKVNPNSTDALTLKELNDKK